MKKHFPLLTLMTATMMTTATFAADTAPDTVPTFNCFIRTDIGSAPLYDKPDGSVTTDIYSGRPEGFSIEVTVQPADADYWQIVSYYDYDIEDDRQPTQYFGLYAPADILGLTARAPAVMYAEPTTQSQVICHVAFDDEVCPVAISGQWLKVRLVAVVTDQYGHYKATYGDTIGWMQLSDLCGSAWTNCN